MGSIVVQSNVWIQAQELKKRILSSVQPFSCGSPGKWTSTLLEDVTDKLVIGVLLSKLFEVVSKDVCFGLSEVPQVVNAAVVSVVQEVEEELHGSTIIEWKLSVSQQELASCEGESHRRSVVVGIDGKLWCVWKRGLNALEGDTRSKQGSLTPLDVSQIGQGGNLEVLVDEWNNQILSPLNQIVGQDFSGGVAQLVESSQVVEGSVV
mmetsp:Transcript_25585/g.35911  ORF Transcript_25585/g.35911 Transcript_25585/m.35911 type:complete len:207 (+) Transcript_25585:1354-1974(+)